MSSLLPNPGRHGKGLFSRHLQPIPSRVLSASIRPSTASKDLLRSPCVLPKSPFLKEVQKVSPPLMLRFLAGIVAVAWSKRPVMLFADAMLPMVGMQEVWPLFCYAKESTKLLVGGDDASAMSVDGSLGFILESQGRKTMTLTAALAPDRSGGGMRQEEMGLGSSRKKDYGLEPVMSLSWCPSLIGPVCVVVAALPMVTWRPAAAGQWLEAVRKLFFPGDGGGGDGMEVWEVVPARVCLAWASYATMGFGSVVGLAQILGPV